MKWKSGVESEWCQDLLMRTKRRLRLRRSVVSAKWEGKGREGKVKGVMRVNK